MDQEDFERRVAAIKAVFGEKHKAKATQEIKLLRSAMKREALEAERVERNGKRHVTKYNDRRNL